MKRSQPSLTDGSFNFSRSLELRSQGMPPFVRLSPCVLLGKSLGCCLGSSGSSSKSAMERLRSCCRCCCSRCCCRRRRSEARAVTGHGVDRGVDRGVEPCHVTALPSDADGDSRASAALRQRWGERVTRILCPAAPVCDTADTADTASQYTARYTPTVTPPMHSGAKIYLVLQP